MSDTLKIERKTDDERREQRIAARVAARHSAEWRSGGEQLTQQRVEQQRVDLAARAAAAQQRAVEFWELQCATVRPSTLTRHSSAFEQWLASAAADQSVEPESVAYDVLCSYITSEVLFGRANRARVAVAIELLRTVYALTIEDALDTLQRLISVESVAVTPARHTHS